MVDSKLYRLRELIDPLDGRSLVVDTSSGLSLGPLSGLEHFSEAVTPILPWADGIVTSPGQARKLHGRQRTDAALLVNGDWTNAFRGREFVLPKATVNAAPSGEAALSAGKTVTDRTMREGRTTWRTRPGGSTSKLFTTGACRTGSGSFPSICPLIRAIDCKASRYHPLMTGRERKSIANRTLGFGR